MTLLQVALDHLPLYKAAALAQRLGNAVDLIEAGTPLLAREGVNAIRVLRAALPSAQLVADYKLIDAAQQIARMAFEAGANWVSLLGCADDVAVRETALCARSFGAHACADLLGIADPLNRAGELLDLGMDCVTVHASAANQQGAPRVLPWGLIDALAARNLPFAIAGGVSLANIAELRARNPHILMIGTAITAAPDPLAAARLLKGLK